MLSLLLLTCCFSSSFLSFVTAQSKTTASSPTTTTTTAAAFASIVPSTAVYQYIGCYNETTGFVDAGNVRALAGGNMTATDQMTVNYCLSFCGSNMYAGLEYGRECWCAPNLNSNSQKLADSNCSTRCAADDTQVCGDRLKLTMYKHKDASQTSGAGVPITWSRFVCFLSVLGLLGIVLG